MHLKNMPEIQLVKENEEMLAITSRVESYLHQSYLTELPNYEVVTVEDQEISLARELRFIKISKIIYDPHENIQEKLINVFSTIHLIKSSLILILDSDGKEIDFYLGVKSPDVTTAESALRRSLTGNFPGTQFKKLYNDEAAVVKNRIFTQGKRFKKTVASVSGIPSLKDEASYIQGLEKLLDTMHEQAFSAVFLADPVGPVELELTKQGYEEVASVLSPLAETVTTSGINESLAVSENLSHTVATTISESLSKTKSYTEGSNLSNATGVTKKDVSLQGIKDGIIGIGAGVAVGVAAGSPVGGALGFLGGVMNFAPSMSDTSTEGESRSETASETEDRTETKGMTDGIDKGRSETRGYNQSVQITYHDKKVKSILERVDKQLERLIASENYGLWNFAAYFLAEDVETVQVAASTYQSLIRGEESSLEKGAVNLWLPHEGVSYERMLASLQNFAHPFFAVENTSREITPGSLIHTRELAIAYGFPRKSTRGLPVLEMAEFGRDVRTLSTSKVEEVVDIGKIYHLGRTEEEPVKLDLQSLARHTFITGSTGSGKSNTVYYLLDQLNKENIKFLVIEPIKGEYKQIFGGRDDVYIFGTNPEYSPQLKINPFRFPKEVHVLEHIDTLIEIFNACWPMYAAMPAILKESVERSYVQAGWNLKQSMHFERQETYPTLQLLVDNLIIVIRESDYSEEVKSNYTGSLVTRVKSLMNGIAGNILVSDEIDNEILFDENCIVDLSRVGSNETKSLLMGILFMRLQEHRVSTSQNMNEKLKHVTVLEEAHHLLRRNVTEASEGADMQGKSVEMIANGIAEMRTYGEGFIIADQSPNLLDISVLRNTNTKIIMRLAEEQDRLDVGMAAALTPEQIEELPKLETGVAVIYQNDWLQPVLSKVHQFTEANPLIYQSTVRKNQIEKRKIQTAIVEYLLLGKITSECVSFQQMKEFVEQLSIDSYQKEKIVNWLQNKQLNLSIIEKGNFLYALIDAETLFIYADIHLPIFEFNKRFERALLFEVKSNYQEMPTFILEAILKALAQKNPMYESFYIQWSENQREELKRK